MIKNQAGQVVTANLVARADGESITSGTVTVKVLGDGGTKAVGLGTIENEGDGTWSYFPAQAETNYSAVTYSFSHTDALRVDIQFNPEDAPDSLPPMVAGVRTGYFGAGYFGGAQIVNSYQLLNGFSGAILGAVTLSDIVERVGERIGGFDGDTRTIRMVKRAARDAIRELPTKSDWKYYIRDYLISVSAPVDLTLDYVHSTKTATVSAGTIPSDAEFGELSIAGVAYSISSVSGSQIVLDYNSNPGEDFSGTATWVRSTYRIPNATKIYGLWRLPGSVKIEQISPQQLSARKVVANYIGSPVFFSVGAESVLGATDLMLSPAPGAAEQYKMSATFAPIMPSVFQDFGHATGASGATTVDIPEATSGWLGCILRVAVGSSDKQTDLRYEDYTWQAVITGVAGTSVTLSEAIPSTFSAEMVLVSSVVDIDTEAMQTYYEALVYSYYCRNSHNEHLEEAEALASRLYMGARNADAKVDRSTPRVGFSWPYGVFPDTRLYSSRG